MPYMPESPSLTELDDIVKVSPPVSYVALAGMDKQPGQPKVKLEPVGRDTSDDKQSNGGGGQTDFKQQVEEVDVQKMVEETVRRVREQSDR